MPRWARFLSCSFTGLVIATAGFFFTAWWREGGPGFWQATIDFMATSGFWYLAGLFGALVAVGLLLARVAAAAYGSQGPVLGILSGAAVALVYSFFLVSAHAPGWGGLWLGLQRSWGSMAIFAAPFALAGGSVTWLWERMNP
jgi:hypothetical protein